MLTTYFKTAWRNLLKHKGFSIINICGLAIGLAAFGFISLYIIDELSYDRYHEKSDRIFRVAQHGKWSGGTFDLAITSAPYAAALKNDFPDVEEAVRMSPEGGGKISYNNKQFDSGSIFFADNSVFNIFSYRFLYGDPRSALSAPRSIVLTKSMAARLFNEPSQALHKTVYFDGNFGNTVTGVIDDVPVNSHLTFNALRSFESNYTSDWANAEVYTYVLLKDPSAFKKIESNSTVFYKKYLNKALANVDYRMELQPLRSIHLYSGLGYEAGSTGSITYIYIFTVIGLLILIIAVINYVNLTTARSSARVKEIGVRKVIGSGRRSLIFMFFSESVLLTLFATFAALAIMQFLMPYFNGISGKSLSLFRPGFLKISASAATFAVFTGILSGIYPAFFLSGFRTIPAMKGQTGDQSSTVLFRQSLVTFQFVIAIVMIAGSMIIYNQLNYVSTKDLGFNKVQTLTFHINKESVRGQVSAIKQRLLQNHNVESVAVAGNPIGNNDLGGTSFNSDPGGKSDAGRKSVQNLIVDEDFIKTMQITVAAGRNFSASMATDKTDAVIINETLAHELGWENAVGRKALFRDQVKTVIGVIKDFNTYSLQHKIAPVVLNMPAEASDQDNLYVRIGKSNVQSTLDYISTVYSEFDSENKAEFHFLDENFSHQYKSEQKQGTLLVFFTVLAISLASLGLFGLVAFAAEQRRKEIGIRKVLGASVSGITVLLSKDLLKLVALAMFIAVPVSVWAMNSWLQNFAYHVSIQWWVFVVSGIIAFVIALTTVSFQAIKAALANPATNLKAE